MKYYSVTIKIKFSFLAYNFVFHFLNTSFKFNVLGEKFVKLIFHLCLFKFSLKITAVILPTLCFIKSNYSEFTDDEVKKKIFLCNTKNFVTSILLANGFIIDIMYINIQFLITFVLQ